MDFFDDSKGTDERLKGTAAYPGYPVINIGLETKDEAVGASVGNIGLSRYQFSIGFNGNDDRRVLAVANHFVSELKKHWNVIEVPKNRGAFPLPICDATPNGMDVHQKNAGADEHPG